MTQPQLAAGPLGRLFELPARLEEHAGFGEVVASLQGGHGATLDGVWGSSCALVAATFERHAPALLVVVCARQADVDPLIEDLALFSTAKVGQFPAWESSPGERMLHDEVLGERLRVLKSLLDPDQASSAAADPARILVTSIQSLLQPVPTRQRLLHGTRRLAKGDRLDVQELLRWLVTSGFHSTSAVELPGEFSLRGGILDIFAIDWDNPVRIELFDDEIESIRSFEVESQRSLASLDSVSVTVLPTGTVDPESDELSLLTEEHRNPETHSDGRSSRTRDRYVNPLAQRGAPLPEPAPETAADREHFGRYLPEGSWFLLVEPAEIAEEARHYLQRVEQPTDFHELDDVYQEMFRFPSVTAAGVSTGSMEATCHLRIESVERFSGDIHKVRDELDTATAGQDVVIVCPTEAEVERLGEVFRETKSATSGRLHLVVGRLQSGFRLVSERIALVSSAELFHRSDLSRPSRRRLGRVIDSFLELREGDYVVHLSHGIGRYRGLKLLEKNDQTEEHLELEYEGGTKIYVPATNIELVQKYVGGTKSRPTLAKIGGKTWVRQKQAAQQAVIDMAADMLRLQAARASQPGIRFQADTEWQREFDAAFPYNETPDQLTAIAAIKRDMLEPRPMDRLLCGDVGFGKTEMAMRAAFKAVDSGYQVAVLVPTTILAEQHRRTFTERLSEFPFDIAALSRFSTSKQQKQVLEGIASGAIDIVIGTHRLAQADVRFNNLGLLIIDEEQRFGVEIKERLKALRTTVDVLTMTATPIPRTLHMSLLGLRDISNLETPPADRLAVETRVTRFNRELIRHAVMRELNRGGQMFFVHNRVQDIETVANRLKQIVPEARVVIGHGQMAEGELEKVMLDFINHRYDILLATTIIESGLDIPNANTIFIDEADRYGLADLHQLRGRVGRYKHRAYCYLLVDENKHLSGIAAKRLRAIEEFSDMGAGFAISMRDLEIRGAGNILGTQQSGHIAAVGYELYCNLLEQAVRQLKKMGPKETVDVDVDLPGQAYIPRTYVPDMRLKIDLYRRLARVARREELQDLGTEMVDRFGPRPKPVDRLLALAELRIDASRWRISAIHLEPGYAVFTYRIRKRIEQLAADSGGRLRIVDDRSAYLPLEKGLSDPDALLEVIKSLLQA